MDFDKPNSTNVQTEKSLLAVTMYEANLTKAQYKITKQHMGKKITGQHNWKSKLDKYTPQCKCIHEDRCQDFEIENYLINIHGFHIFTYIHNYTNTRGMDTYHKYIFPCSLIHTDPEKRQTVIPFFIEEPLSPSIHTINSNSVFIMVTSSLWNLVSSAVYVFEVKSF